jgi:hypothetical protein
MRLRAILCPALLTAILPIYAQQSNLSVVQPATDYLQKAVKMQLAWGAPMSTPGSTLELRETRRERIDDRTVVTYRIYGHGLPSDQVYTLVRWPLNGLPEAVLSGVTLTQDGLAVCSGAGPQFCGDSATPNDPIDLKTFGGNGIVTIQPTNAVCQPSVTVPWGKHSYKLE